MRLMIVGGGGREHVLAEAAARSSRVDHLICAPGNAGTSAIAENVSIDPMNIDEVIAAAKEHAIDLIIVGPEAPLCAGLVDRAQAEGLRIFGPTAAAARIEGDKSYAKELMRKCNIPAAEGRSFTRIVDAKAYVATRDTPQVVKASGLAAGKGVVVCDEPSDALNVLDDMMVAKQFGEAGQTVVVEERLRGTELSVLAFVDGRTIYVLETAQDHKALNDGDQGPNTGGMGAFSPSPLATPEVMHIIEGEILVPIVDGLRTEGAPYRGVLYAGIMLTPGGPKVLEFNCRFGDPEAQAVLHRLRSDLIEVIEATVDGRLDSVELEWDPRPALCVVMSSGGYPKAYENGKIITGLEDAAALEDVKVYHAGTRQLETNVVTDGGRVLGITASGDTMAKARERAYAAIDCIHFDNPHNRHDIGQTFG